MSKQRDDVNEGKWKTTGLRAVVRGARGVVDIEVFYGRAAQWNRLDVRGSAWINGNFQFRVDDSSIANGDLERVAKLVLKKASQLAEEGEWDEGATYPL